MMNRWCVLGLVLAGCGVDRIDLSVAAQATEGDPCDPLSCGGNSDLLGLLEPYELDATGVSFSRKGWRITDAKLAERPVTDLTVIGTSIHATYPGGVATGADLVGLTLTLQHTDGRKIDKSAALTIVQGPVPVPYYAAGVPADIEGFRVSYDRGVGPTELCPYASLIDQGVASDWAVFWRGDRYDPVTGKIFASDSAVDSWFNISCAGEATIKMLRARTGGAVAPSSPVEQRQATLNMFTASYCGPIGQRYTKLGQAIAWSDRSGPDEIGAVSSYEALWTSKGAVCLDTPRLVDRNAVACGIPSCSQDMRDHWQDFAWLLSGNPSPGT